MERKLSKDLCLVHPMALVRSSSQYYFDSTDVGRALPCVNALHGKTDLRTPVAVWYHLSTASALIWRLVDVNRWSFSVQPAKFWEGWAFVHRNGHFSCIDADAFHWVGLIVILVAKCLILLGSQGPKTGNCLSHTDIDSYNQRIQTAKGVMTRSGIK
jgi:hypothetical protein